MTPRADDIEFAEAIAHLWAAGMRARLRGEDLEIYRPRGKPTTYYRLKTAIGRAQAMEAAEAKRARKAAKLQARP